MRKKILIGVYHPSIILTFLGTFASFLGIVSLRNFWDLYSSADTFGLSLIFLIISGICDMFDGTVANLFKRDEIQKNVGIQLDSLADVVSFVIFPAYIIYCVSRYSSIGIIVSLLYMFAGITRLAWFNVITKEGDTHFVGLPVTFSALIFPLLYVLKQFFNFSFSVLQVLFLVFGILISLMFVLNIKIKKPRIVARIIIGAIAIFMIIFLLCF